MLKPAPAVYAAGLAAVVLQAAGLATTYFSASINADYLYSQRFAATLLDGIPLSGAAHSPAPYFFPDMALSVLLVALTGGAPILPWYAMISFAALAVVSGWSLSRVTGGGWGGWMGGVVLVNALLVWRGFSDHALYLWWLGTAGFHGGAVILGLGHFALWTGPVDERPSRRRRGVATLILFLGLVSDILLFTQFVLPLAMAMVIDARGEWSKPRLRSYWIAIATAGAGVVIFRIGGAIFDFGTFKNLARHAPLPLAIAEAAAQFGRDLFTALWSRAAVFVMVGVAGSAALALLAVRIWKRRSSVSAERRQAVWFALASLGVTVVMPIVTVYWRSEFNARHLLPGLVLPVWGGMAALLTTDTLTSRKIVSQAGLWAIGGAFAVVALAGWRQMRVEAWNWPYSSQIAALDQLLKSEGRTRGLGDYWNSHVIMTLSRAGIRLNQLRPDGRVYFWNNNALIHYQAGPDEELRVAHYSFIVANGLDADALRAKFGEPQRQMDIEGLEVWLYDQVAAARMTALVDAEVRTFLGDRADELPVFPEPHRTE